MVTTVRDILRGKGSSVFAVTPDTSVYDALRLMADKNIGAVLVMDGSRLVGIFSERDYARKMAFQDKTDTGTTMSEIMTERVVYVEPQQACEDCMAIMTDKRVRHLPVLEGEQVIGVISIGDVVKSIIDDREFIIEQLEHYITGVR